MVIGGGGQISDPRAGHAQALPSGKYTVAGPVTNEELRPREFKGLA